MSLKKILITVKTYPNLSKTYKELVCTAGLDEEGNWYRVYPIPFRTLTTNEQYKKYDWIEVDIEKSKDFRKESYKIKNIEVDEPIKVVGNIGTGSKRTWAARKEIVLSKAQVHTNLEALIKEAKNEDKANRTSLAVFKPSRITGFKWVAEAEREWSKEKLEALNQLSMFEEDAEQNFEVVRKLPFKFHYIFEDDSGKESKPMIEDWEVGALYWRVFDDTNDEEAACKAVRKRFYEEFVKKDLHFFLGTTFEHHMRAPNPFIIIGVFYPPVQTQYSMF